MKDIKDYEGWYEIDHCGNIYSKERVIKYSNGRVRKHYPKKLKLRKNHKGYLRVTLCKSGLSKQFRVSRLVAITYIPNPGGKRFVNHKDGNKENNCIDNLEWCTHSENIMHADRTGLRQVAKGENHGNSKLTRQEVIEIKRRLIKGDRLAIIASDYNIGLSTVSHIKTGRLWHHVEYFI